MTDNTNDQMPDAQRRAILTGAVAGAASLAMTGVASAQSATTTDISPTGSRFEGKTVLITGGTSGIGRVTAEEFAREGATVEFCGRRADLGAQVEAGIRSAGGTATYTQLDVRREAELQAWINTVAERNGQLDVAFNNAGIAIPPGPMEDTSVEGYAEIIDTNLNGVFWAMHAQVPIMKRQGGGVIINTSSTFGSHAPNTQVAYGATKGAVDIMVKGLSKEVAAEGIRVLGIAPGAIVDTDLFRFIGRDWTEDEIAFFGTLHAVARAGRPIDVARVVLMLASDDAGFMTGRTIFADGQIIAA